MDYSVEVIVQNLVEALVIDESYLLVYAIVKPWYSRNQWAVSEDLVLRIGEGSSFAAVVATLEDLAEAHDCSMISVGGALARNSRAITRLYQRHGFVPETGLPQLTKRRR